MTAKIEWSEEEEDFLRQHQDETNAWISQHIDKTVSESVIGRKFKQLGIVKIYDQVKHIDQSPSFSDKEMGYCLGVFASDGCLTVKKNGNGTVVKRFALTLAIKDVEWLLAIFKLLTGEIVGHKICPPTLGKTDKVNYYASLKNFIAEAEKFGITPNKSKT